jgi:hypothetical protein
MTVHAWISAQKHLPRFLRQEEAQTLLIQYMYEAYQDSTHRRTFSLNDGQRYLFQVFLPGLARCGYTLQKRKMELLFRPLPPEINAARASDYQACYRWLESGRNLPVWLRDFHDQKDFFKGLFFAYREHPALVGLDWISGHQYSIDWFVWFMGSRGYTIQKCRKKQDYEALFAAPPSRLPQFLNEVMNKGSN